MPVVDPEVSVHPSVCPLDCADTCSLSIQVKHGRVTAVRGSHANPTTRGKICSKVVSGLPEQVHGSNRLTNPLRRIQGERDWEEISWPQALDIIHQNFLRIIADHGPQAIVPLSYGGPMGLLAGNSMDKRFFNRLGATQVDSSTLCAGVSGAAYEALFGDAGGIPYAELCHSKLIVVWGNNITVCNLHMTKLLREARKKGAKLVVVDPKRIRIADEADLHLPLIPGTDVVLGYAVAAELARQKALNSDFIAAHVHGGESYIAEAMNYSVKDAAAICGLTEQDIHRFVDLWRELSPAAISIGVAPERNRNGGAGIRAAFSLLALTGNIGPKGAGVCDVSGFFPIQSDALRRPDLRPEGTREISILDIPQHILNPGDEIPIKGVFIYNHNPIAVHPRQREMRQALLREDVFVVGSDISMTDSMACADIILPAATHLEYGDVYKAYGHHYLQRSAPVIPPVAQALPNTELFRRLAAQFGFEESCFTDSDLELANQSIASETPALNGRQVTDLALDEALDMRTKSNSVLLRGATANTPSGKIELFSDTLEQSCGQGLPKFQGLETKRRFILVSPSSGKRTNSTFGAIDEHDVDLSAEINEQDAAMLKLSDGQQVRLFNDQGDVILPLQVSDRVRPGTVYVPKGAWIKDSPTGQTINSLIPGHKADIAGGACYNDATIDIAAIEI